MKPKHMVACCALILLFWGCAGHKDTKFQPSLPSPVPIVDPESVVANLEQINRELISFKGVGKIKIWKQDSLQSTRIAWAGIGTEKLRLEILGIAGRPLSSVAFDGRRFYLSLHAENRFYQKQTREANLKRLISIPITIQDTLAVLSGRVPLWENASVSLTEQPHKDAYILIMKKKWFGTQTAKIYLGNDLFTVSKFELYGSDDELRYRVNFLKRKQYDKYRLPVLLRISDGQRNRIQISADRIWPDAEISTDTFVLRKPQ